MIIFTLFLVEYTTLEVVPFKYVLSVDKMLSNRKLLSVSGFLKTNFLKNRFLIGICSCICNCSVSKESACNAGDPGLIPESGRSPGAGNGNHPSILVWRIPWTEEQSVGSQESDMT